LLIHTASPGTPSLPGDNSKKRLRDHDPVPRIAMRAGQIGGCRGVGQRDRHDLKSIILQPPGNIAW